MATRTRTDIEPLVGSYIEEEARLDKRATARVIGGRVGTRLRRAGFDLPIPKERAIQVRAKAARQIPGPTLEDPWNLGNQMSQIPPGATGDLLAVWKVSLLADRRFTIRQATWVARLGSALQGAPPDVLFNWSRLYEIRERIYQEKGLPMDTDDLDAELAFQVWKSRTHEWEYDQAVLTGTVPSLAESRDPIYKQSLLLGSSSFTPFFLEQAREFLRGAGGKDIDNSSWWPHAESVMVFWLTRISGNVEKWESIEDSYRSDFFPEEWHLGDLDEDGKEELWSEIRHLSDDWDYMGMRLAEMVINKAKDLDSGGREEETWKPTELLREISYKE